MSAYTQAVEHCTEGLTAVSTGPCPGCAECRDDYGYDSQEAFDADYESGRICAEPHFSWRGCELCGSPLGGDFEEWHALDANGELIHGARACVDCVCYLANGDEPENWEGGAV
jgi:hypothetical protein